MKSNMVLQSFLIMSKHRQRRSLFSVTVQHRYIMHPAILGLDGSKRVTFRKIPRLLHCKIIASLKSFRMRQ
jgi:hypothetical protein